MDEKYSFYLDKELSQKNFFYGEISGYILDSMVEDKDMYQFEKECTYFSYEDILSNSEELSPLLEIYDEKKLNDAQIKFDNKNHKKDFFKARGFWVYKSNESKIEEYINQYKEIFKLTQKEEFESMTFPGFRFKSYPFKIHKGDFCFYDYVVNGNAKVHNVEKTKEHREEAERNAKRAEIVAKSAQLAADFMLDPNAAPDAKSLSVGTAAMIGGALAGTTGAIIGASSSMEKRREHEGYVQNYNNLKNKNLREAMDAKAEERYWKQEMWNRVYDEVPAGDVYFVIRTLFGVLPAIVPYIRDYQKDTYKDYFEEYICGDNRKYKKSLEKLSCKDNIDKRWKGIEKYLSTNELPLNTEESLDTKWLTEYVNDDLIVYQKDYETASELLDKIEKANGNISIVKSLQDKLDICQKKHQEELEREAKEEREEKLRELEQKHKEYKNIVMYSDSAEELTKAFLGIKNTYNILEDPEERAIFKDSEELKKIAMERRNKIEDERIFYECKQKIEYGKKKEDWERAIYELKKISDVCDVKKYIEEAEGKIRIHQIKGELILCLIVILCIFGCYVCLK